MNDMQIQEYMFIQDKVTSEYASQINYLTKFILNNQSKIPTKHIDELTNKLQISNEILIKLLAKTKQLNNDIKD